MASPQCRAASARCSSLAKALAAWARSVLKRREYASAALLQMGTTRHVY
jgi:hypothetical protein